MFGLTDIVAAFRRGRMRQAAIRDLHRLSREQLADVGIPEDRLGDVIDAMLARPQPLDTSARITPELEGRGPITGVYMARSPAGRR
jgi:hypothetical protein